MQGLLYLFLTRMKNRLKELVKSPSKLILTIAIIAIMAFVIFAGNMSDGEGSTHRSIEELYAIIFALYSSMFILVSYGGFNRGASLFSMADVNILFPSPITSVKILFYGLIQQIGNSLLLGLFLIFQYAWLHDVYGVTIGGLIIILIGYGITVFCGQLTAMVIYSLTSSREERRKVAKAIFAITIGIFSGGILFTSYGMQGTAIEKLVKGANGTIAALFPLGGWIKSSVSGALSKNYLLLLSGLGAVILYVIAIVLLIVKKKADYYEDVLQATEVSFSAITSRKEGRIGEAAPQNIKLGKTGINKGFGASTIYYKQRLESRRARTLFLDMPSLLFIAMVIVFSFIMKNIGIAAVFAFSTYMQIFTIALGRWVKELIYPYIYLIPEPPFKKLINCIRESFPKMLMEAVLMYIPVGIILKLSPVAILLCILARLSFGFLFIAGNLLVERIFGTTTTKGLLMIFYFLTLIILVIPGILAAVMLTLSGFIIISEDITILLSLAVVNIPISLLIIFLCRNVLEYAELNNK